VIQRKIIRLTFCAVDLQHKLKSYGSLLRSSSDTT